MLAPNSSILLLFMWLLFCVSHGHPGQVTESRIWLRTRGNLLLTELQYLMDSTITIIKERSAEL